MTVALCRLRCRPRHLSDEGRKTCNMEFQCCGRCRKYIFMKWEWRFCGELLSRAQGQGWPWAPVEV